ncbi:hypothetical protein H7J88_07445 [Mycolicibacterium flavescens]|uniref:Uncharacterized protein n=1 Tax=Mycolicibacterium flavescens TaxID=1776 RepID=A0A1E3RPZ2_MYCFV|nr:hypothetical protein [Mycolicibacterium flavescens]MCV7279479.1 hypothetical protein [Mycolicibacterium flavescens]ODQ91921.1 hypothetical protein BHQ18_03475 [Mycolicibacterium flavescens]
MVTVPAVGWRGGPVYRAVASGGAVGVALGVLAWIDSGMWLTAVIVLVAVGSFYGFFMQRRMARFWPSASELTGRERVNVVRTARRGEAITDAALAQFVVDYGRGLRAAADAARPFRWVVSLVLVVAIGTAVWDTVFGSWGNAVVSVLYLAALLAELFWWPKRRQQLLDNVDRAAAFADRHAR